MFCSVSWYSWRPDPPCTPRRPRRKKPARRPKAIEKASFGTVDGKPVDLYTLTNAKGATAKITNYGTIVVDLQMPDKAGKMGASCWAWTTSTTT